MHFGAVLAGKGHVGQHVVLAGVHQLGEFGPARPELIGHVAPHLPGLCAVGLVEGLADGGGDHGVLALGDMRQGVAHPVNAAALPGGLKNAFDGGPEAAVRIADHQLDPGQPPGFEGPQELHPEGLRFRRAKPQADDLPAPVGVGGDGDYGGHRDDPSAPTHLEVGGVEPDIGPVAGERTVQEIVHPLVDILAELGDRALGDAGEPHRLRQLVDTTGGDATDPGFLDHGNQGPLGGLARLQEAGEIAALPQLGHLQVQRAQAGIERALAIAVAPGGSALSPLMPAGADQSLDIGLHEKLKNGLGDGAQKIALIVLLQKLGKVHVGLGHRGLRVVRG